MKNLDARQNMLEFQRSSPAQDLADTKSFVGQASQDGNEAEPKSSSYALFTRSGVAVFKYCDSELLNLRSTLLVSFVRPETSWHGRIMSLVEMTRSAVSGPK